MPLLLALSYLWNPVELGAVRSRDRILVNVSLNIALPRLLLLLMLLLLALTWCSEITAFWSVSLNITCSHMLQHGNYNGVCDVSGLP